MQAVNIYVDLLIALTGGKPDFSSKYMYWTHAEMKFNQMRLNITGKVNNNKS